MIKIPVYLRDMYDAKHLVQAASGCRKDVELICGRYVVDAKSILGVFSLPTFNNVEIGAEEEDVKELRNLHRRWIRSGLEQDGKKKIWERFRSWWKALMVTAIREADT